MRLYDLTKELAIVQRELEAFEDDESAFDALAHRLGSLEVALEQKILACCAVKRGFEAEAAALDEEIKRLTARKKARENQAERMKEYVRDGMITAGIDKVKSEFFTISLSQGRENTIVDDSKVFDWPAEIFDKAKAAGVIQEKVTVNKSALKKLEGWEKLPGISVVEGDPYITIK